MNRRLVLLMILALVAVLAAAGWRWQWQANRRLQAELATARLRQSEWANLRQENERLRATAAADTEIEALRADHALLVQLRAEYEQLGKTAAATAGVEAPPAPRPLPASAWRNRGREGAQETLETMLWAAKHGETAVLASTFYFSPKDAKRVETAWNEAGPDVKAKFASAAEFFAAQAARSMQAASVTWLEEYGGGTFGGPPPVLLSLPDRSTKRVRFVAVEQTDHTWKLRVPEKAIDAFLQSVKTFPVETDKSP